MSTFALIIAAASLVVAFLALWRAGSAGRRAERLSESYWELRYEIGQLKVRTGRVEAAAGLVDAAAEPPVEAPRAAATTSFIPLSSLKK